LQAILGEMKKNSGVVQISASIAYCVKKILIFKPQQAWIQNATLMNNITFGLPYEKEKFYNIIDICALKTDIEILQGGVMTEM
jgi:hypothetical protein